MNAKIENALSIRTCEEKPGILNNSILGVKIMPYIEIIASNKIGS